MINHLAKDLSISTRISGTFLFNGVTLHTDKDIYRYLFNDYIVITNTTPSPLSCVWVTPLNFNVLASGRKKGNFKKSVSNFKGYKLKKDIMRALK